MRENSPTGGALGQVTERELAFLQSVEGSLDQAQSEDQLRQILQRLRDGQAYFREQRRQAYVPGLWCRAAVFTLRADRYTRFYPLCRPR